MYFFLSCLKKFYRQQKNFPYKEKLKALRIVLFPYGGIIRIRL